MYIDICSCGHNTLITSSLHNSFIRGMDVPLLYPITYLYIVQVLYVNNTLGVRFVGSFYQSEHVRNQIPKQDRLITFLRVFSSITGQNRFRNFNFAFHPVHQTMCKS